MSFTKYEYPYYKCDICELLFTPNIREQDIITENDDSIQRNNEKDNNTRIDRILSFGLPNTKTILDFGCGAGLFLKTIQNKGLTAIGIDKNTELNLTAIGDNTVDAISIVEVVEYLFTPFEYFKEFSRILKPKGIMYIETCPSNTLDPETGFYCDPRFGHCTIYSKKSFEYISTFFNLIYFELNSTVFVFKKN